MSSVVPIAGDWPELVIRIETAGRLDLGNVGRFLQRVNTSVRSGRPVGTSVPRVEVVNLQTGSIELRIAALALAVSSGQLAIQVYEFFTSNEAAARVGNDLLTGDNAVSITINGGSNTFVIGPRDAPRLERVAERAAASRRDPGFAADIQYLSGPTTGFLSRQNGEWWASLDDREGLMLRIVDERQDRSPFNENLRYRFVGEPFIGQSGRLSGYILREAMSIE